MTARALCAVRLVFISERSDSALPGDCRDSSHALKQLQLDAQHVWTERFLDVELMPETDVLD